MRIEARYASLLLRNARGFSGGGGGGVRGNLVALSPFAKSRANCELRHQSGASRSPKAIVGPDHRGGPRPARADRRPEGGIGRREADDLLEEGGKEGRGRL